MKLNKRQVEKIVKMLKNNEYIIDTLIERAGNMIEDCDEEQDVLEEGDYLLINYSAEGDVRITKEPSTYFTPGWMDEELVYKYCTSLNSSDVHFISSRDTISVFCKQNSIRRPRRSFTCLLDYEGNVLIKGGMPQKDMESFKHYSLCIKENQYRNN